MAIKMRSYFLKDGVNFVKDNDVSTILFISRPLVKFATYYMFAGSYYESYKQHIAVEMERLRQLPVNVNKTMYKDINPYSFYNAMISWITDHITPVLIRANQ